MVSKKMHGQILSDVRSKSLLIQFKNSDSTIAWFKKIENKRRKSFIQFDVCDFYGSISQNLVENSLTFVAKYTAIDELCKKIILQACNSFLVCGDKTLIKKSGGTFDITMGGYHGAEICDLVGLFLLSPLLEMW